MKNWEIKKLGDVIQKTETTDPTKKPESEFTYIDVSSVNNQGFFVENTSTIIGKDAPSRARKLIRTNDVIFATVRPTLKRIAIIEEELNKQVCSTGYFVLRAKENIHYKLLFYFLLTDGFISKMEILQKGASYPAVTDGEVRNQIIAYPKSLPEQQYIVSILDEAFAAIAKAKANAEQNLKNAKELFESYLQGVFENKLHGNKSNALEDLCELIVDCEHKTAPTQETGYPSIRTPNIGKGVLILEGVNRVSEETYLDWTKRAIPMEDDLILAREAPAGNVAVIPENLKVCLGQRTVLIRPKKDKLNSKYLAQLLLSKDVQEQFLSHSRGATVAHINMKDIRAFKIYNLSSISEQQTIVSKLDALSVETKRLEGIYKQKIEDLEELKKSVLQKAFRGELTLNAYAPAKEIVCI